MLSATFWLANAQQGVVAYWPFDSMAGDTFRDNSGNGYNATWTGSGVGLTQGFRGNAVECPITGGYDIAVANSANSFVMNHFSIEAWVSADTIMTGSQQKILDFCSVTTGIRNGYSIDLDAGRPTLTASSFDGSAWIDDIAPSVIQSKTWYHLVGTFDSLSLRIYVNGILQNTAAAQGGIRPPDANATIGCEKSYTGSLGYFFGGKIDELKVYNYTLPADSILAHYQNYTQVLSQVSPANGAVNQPIALTLAWACGSSYGGAPYALQVSTTMNFSTTVVAQTGLTAVSSAISGLANSTVYYWHVNATTASGTGNWTNAWSFTTVPLVPGVPALASPANGASNQPLSLNCIWGASSSGASYTIQLSTSSSFSPTTVNQTGLTGTVAPVSGLSTNATYFWRVNATNTGGSSTWSAVWSFATILVAPNIPVLLAPASGTTGQPIASTLYWSAANGASTYGMQVSTSSVFSTTVINQTGISTTSASINGLAYSTTCYWKVNASGTGGTSAWSSAWNFVTTPPPAPSTPGLSSPPNGAANQPTALTFFWGAAAGATSYSLQISKVSNFAATFSNQAGITGTSLNITGLAIGSTYYWHVNAANAGGAGSWSDAWSFTVTASSVSVSNKITAGPSFCLKHGTMAYSLDRHYPVEIRIYDLAGKEIFEFTRLQSPGSYSLPVKTLNLPSGQLIMRFKAGTFEKQTFMLTIPASAR